MKPVPPTPPRLAQGILRLYLHPVDAGVVLGDLEETYQVLYHQYGPAAAHRWYWSQVLRSIPRFAYRTLYWSCAMLKNYFKIALRNFKKHRGYAFINVFGLAVGIAFCALIFLFVRDEWTYDRHHTNAERIHRVHRVSFTTEGTVEATDNWLPMPMGPALQRDLPEVEAYVRFTYRYHFVQAAQTTVEERVIYADPQLFEVFSFPLLRGNPATALTDLNTVVLSQEAARKYFGEDDPLGKTLAIRLGTDFQDFVVTGVAAPIPNNSNLRFEVLLPFAKLADAFERIRQYADNWYFSAYVTYVLLAENASTAGMDDKLLQFRRKYYPNEVESLRERGHWTGDGIPTSYRMQPLTDIHLNPDVNGGLTAPSNPLYSYLLAAIALAVLGIACINFMTLAIGRSASRAREIGVRKVVGAQRRQLMGQFWAEAVLLSVVALGLGILLAVLFLPTFNALTDKALRFDLATNWTTGAMLATATLLAGLIAGSYPALVLSGFKPVDTLKNKLRLSGSNMLTRSLVVVQFALSVFLVIGTLVMLDQLNYIRTTNLGFDREHLVVVPTNSVDGTLALERYRNELGARSDITGITGSSASFARGGGRIGFEYKGELKQVDDFRVEQNYVDVMGMQLVAGRGFDPNLSTDSTKAVIVNEALVREFGWTEALGEPLTGLTDSPETDPIVIGVLKDYNFQSLEETVDPLMLTLNPNDRIRYLLVRIAPVDIPATLDALRTAWTRLAPDTPFEYGFLDDDLNTLYENDTRWSRILGYASLFALLIACLGLFGLVALTVAARTKEIGIRKVMGATAPGLAVLLSRDFARLVAVALVLAAPVAYFVMEKWLDTFAFRIEMSWWIFLMAGLAALGIALATVSAQTIRAALADPVDSLRYE